MVILPFSAMFFMIRRGFVYTIAVDIYAFRLAFSSILSCVQHQNPLHLAPKRTAFSTKTPCVQHQNALHLAAYCTLLAVNSPQNWCKWWYFQIKIHFAYIHKLTLFASKQTFARIDYLRQDGRMMAKRALRMLKSMPKSGQI